MNGTTSTLSRHAATLFSPLITMAVYMPLDVDADIDAAADVIAATCCRFAAVSLLLMPRCAMLLAPLMLLPLRCLLLLSQFYFRAATFAAIDIFRHAAADDAFFCRFMLRYDAHYLRYAMPRDCFITRHDIDASAKIMPCLHAA